MDDKDKVKAAISLTDVIGETVTLKPLNKHRLTGLCPFHDEKTPSFHVVPDKGFYHCFGCKASGDVFDFVMRTQGVDFPEALQILADRAGIQIDTKTSAPQAALKRGIYGVNKLAMHYYVTQLARNKEAHSYLLDRGLTPEAIKTFNLGYAPDDWEGILNELKDDADTGTLLKAGLVIESKGGKIYDRFRHRIMFPITDATGRVVGFSGRSLSNDGPKYLNTPETEVFDKSSLLYGLEQARVHIRDRNECIVVEGQMDVIALHQVGFNHAVGVLGSSLTKEHAQILQRLDVAHLYLSFDADTAGQKATLSGLDKAIGRQFLTRAVSLPEGKDPADIVLKAGAASFQAALDSGLSEVYYRFNAAVNKYDLSSVKGKKDFLNELLPSLQPRDVFDPVAAEMKRLVVSHLSVDASRLDAWVQKQGGGGRVTDTQIQGLSNHGAPSQLTLVILDLIALMLTDITLLSDRCEWVEPLVPESKDTALLREFFDAAIFSSYDEQAILGALKKSPHKDLLFERLATPIGIEGETLPPVEIDSRLKRGLARLRELHLDLSDSYDRDEHKRRIEVISAKLNNPDLPESEVELCYSEMRELHNRLIIKEAEKQNRLG